MTNDKSLDIHAYLVRQGAEKVVSVVDVWSNGRVIRRYQGQDKSRYNYSTSASNGYRRMTAILIEEVRDNE